MMERDNRLTGRPRGQTDKPEAPFGFEYSNGWKVHNNMSQPPEHTANFTQLEKRYN